MGNLAVFEPDAVYVNILILIKAGAHQGGMGKPLGISRQAVGKRLRILIREGYIKAVKKGNINALYLTDKGIGCLSSRGGGRRLPTLRTIRWHNRWISFNLRTPIQPLVLVEQRKMDFRQMPLKNNIGASFYFRERNVKLWGRTVVISLPDVEMPLENPINALLTIYDEITAYLSELEKRMGIHVNKPDRDRIAVAMQKSEIAFTNDDWAKRAHEIKAKVLIFDTESGMWEEGAKVEAGIDYSKGLPEMEFYGPKQLESADHYRENVIPMYRGEVKLIEMKDIKEALALVAKEQTLQMQFFRTHNELIADIRDYFRMKNQERAEREAEKRRKEEENNKQGRL